MNYTFKKILLGFCSISIFSLAHAQIKKPVIDTQSNILNSVNNFNPYVSEKDNDKLEQLIKELYITKEIISVAQTSCKINNENLSHIDNFLNAINTDKHYKNFSQKHKKHFADNEKNIREHQLKQNEKFSEKECEHIIKELRNYENLLKYFNLVSVGYALVNYYSKDNFNYDKAKLNTVKPYISRSYNDFFLNKTNSNDFYIGYTIEKEVCEQLTEKTSFKISCNDNEIRLWHLI
jgi:G3E family GTPase